MKFSQTVLLFLITYSACFSQIESIDYFGLTRPINTVEEFNPSVLNLDGSFIFNAIYNIPKCNEFYFTKIESKENIYFSKRDNGIWMSPKITSFSDESYHDADPFFALEGNRIYFVSSRPVNFEDDINDYNIWYVDRDKNGWGEPTVLPEPINTDNEEYFFSVSNNGNAFFASNRPGGFGSFDIYKTKLMPNGDMSKPVNIGEPINTEFFEYDPYISPDESLMIFSIDNKPDGFGKSDIYFSYKDDKGKWTSPLNMGDKVNSPKTDFGSSLSPDNKYIIYTNGGQLKWINVEILDSLKTNKSK